jgi:hypothetical protein
MPSALDSNKVKRENVCTKIYGTKEERRERRKNG